MKKIVYCIYGVWAIACIVLKIMGIISWWVALSPVWLPLALALVLLGGIFLFGDVAERLKIHAERKEPDSCANCLFGLTAKYSEDGKCLGEALNSDVVRGKVCKTYQRNRI